MTAYNIVNPGSIVAGQPEDVSQILANLQAIQTILNGNIDGVNLKNYPGDATKALFGDMSWKQLPSTEIGYSQIVANYTTVAVSEATSTVVVSLGALAYDGSAVMLEFWAQAVNKGTSFLNLEFFDGATPLGGSTAAITSVTNSFVMRLKVTPTAGVHTYQVKGWVDAGTGTVFAGAGGSQVNLPCFIRATKV